MFDTYYQFKNNDSSIISLVPASGLMIVYSESVLVLKDAVKEYPCFKDIKDLKILHGLPELRSALAEITGSKTTPEPSPALAVIKECFAKCTKPPETLEEIAELLRGRDLS